MPEGGDLELEFENRDDWSAIEGRVKAGEVDLLLISPERLLAWWKSGFVERLGQLGQSPDLIALDEMHCFEEWRSFREGYLEAFAPVRRLSERGVKLLGLSASLARAEADSVDALGGEIAAHGIGPARLPQNEVVGAVVALLNGAMEQPAQRRAIAVAADQTFDRLVEQRQIVAPDRDG